MLVIDEAHATGVFGAGGRGLGAHLEGRDNVMSLHTCGKALGAMGALVLGPARLSRFPRQSRARLHLRHRAVAADGRGRARSLRNCQSVSRAACNARRQRIRSRWPRTRSQNAASLRQARKFSRSSSAATRDAVALAGDCKRTASTSAPSARRRCRKAPARLRLTLTLNTSEAEVKALIGDRWQPRQGFQAMTHRIVVAGTDTDVGKTVFAAALGAALDGCIIGSRSRPGSTAKPTATLSARLSGLPADRILPEAYRLKTPASPHLAARARRHRDRRSSVWRRRARARRWSSKLAGGLMVPLTRRCCRSISVARWKLPVVLCPSTRLGTINHSLLSIEA